MTTPRLKRKEVNSYIRGYPLKQIEPFFECLCVKYLYYPAHNK